MAHFHWATHFVTALFAKLAKGRYGRSILDQLHKEERKKIMPLYFRFFICLDLFVDCHHCHGGSGTLESSTCPELKSFLRDICTEASESTTKKVALLDLSKSPPALPKLRQESKKYLKTTPRVCKHPLPVPKRLGGHTVLVLGIRLAFFPHIYFWEPLDFAPARAHCRVIPCDGPFYSPNFAGRIAAFENLTVQLDPIFSFWRRIDSLEGRKPPILERHLSLTFVGLPKSLSVQKTLVTVHASRFGLVIQAHGEGANHTTFLCTFV